MRRLWMLAAGAVACAGLAAPAGVAYADTGTSRAATSCSSLIKRYEKTNVAAQHIDFSRPETLSAVFKQAAKAYRQLAASGPSQLRGAFRHLAQGFAQLGSVDFSNPSSITQLESLGRQYADDLHKIAAYFAQRCNFTIPTT